MESGFIIGYEVYQGNPSDEAVLLSAVENHRDLFGSLPHAVATDRGFFSQKNKEQLTEIGVRMSAFLDGEKRVSSEPNTNGNPGFKT